MILCCLIPVRNEADCIDELLARLARVWPQLPEGSRAILIDGGSTDATAEKIRHALAPHPWLEMIDQGPVPGLGEAYRAGMTYALARYAPQFILKMDGDLQHRPEDMPLLLSAIPDADMVIGSRYVPGGSVPAAWGAFRKALSRFGNHVARFILKLWKVRDLTSGFCLYRVPGFLGDFDFSTLLSRRYAYKLHLLVFMAGRGARIREVPIAFGLRAGGVTKFTLTDIFDTLRVAFILRVRGGA